MLTRKLEFHQEFPELPAQRNHLDAMRLPAPLAG
jgi:hypothetical protein